MTLSFTDKPSTHGDEPTELLRVLCYEYLAELNRMNLAEFFESVGKDDLPVLIVVIPHVKIEEGKIIEITMKANK